MRYNRNIKIQGGIKVLYLLLISIIFASLNSVVLHKADLSNGNTVYKINMIVSAVWFFVLFAVNGFKISISSPALIWGIVYGVTQTLFILFKTLAMNSGPVSVTTLIGNMSLVVSVFFCFFVWQEAIAASDIIGLAILMLGTVLTTYKNKKDGKKISRKWIVYSIFFLIFAASVGISFKAFGKTGHADVAGDMMIIASFVMLFLYFIMSKKSRHLSETCLENKLNKTLIIYSLLSGVLSCGYNRLNIYLTSTMSAVVFFPSFNGGVVLLSTVLSIIILREKITLKSFIGIMLGLAGICIIGIL